MNDKKLCNPGDFLQTLAMKPNSHALTESASSCRCAATVTTTVKTIPTNRIASVNKKLLKIY
jgi:hypothetical protein